MIKKNQRFLNFIKLIIDSIILYFSYTMAVFVWLYYNNTINQNIADNVIIAAVFTFINVVLLKIFNSYNNDRFIKIKTEIFQILKSTTSAFLSFSSVLYIFRLEEFSRGALSLSYILATILLILNRYLTRKILGYYRKRGYNIKYIILIGSGEIAQNYITNIKEHSYYGFVCTGYVSNDLNDKLGKHLGKYCELESILDKVYADEIVIALGQEDLENINMIIRACEKNGIKMKLIPYFNTYIPKDPVIDVVGDSSLIHLQTIPLDDNLNRIIKRSFDIVVSLTLIIITFPIMILASIGIKLTSKGPIIFKQERIGRNKKIFTMYKFRSMRITNTHTTGWSKNKDTRKTLFGSFLRKFSIDELPQFFNVLIGNMSLIGPRPEIPFHVNHFKEEIPLYMTKHHIKPGITGWAQVNGFRGDTSIEERIKYDLWYIENWSIFLDIKIIFKTILGGMINSEKINIGK